MKTASRPAPLTAQVQAYQGPLAWRHLVDWLQEDGVISQDEADRTIAPVSASHTRTLQLCVDESIPATSVTASTLLCGVAGHPESQLGGLDTHCAE